jgi:hypothetical protein
MSTFNDHNRNDHHFCWSKQKLDFVTELIELTEVTEVNLPFSNGNVVSNTAKIGNSKVNIQKTSIELGNPMQLSTCSF